MNGLRQTEMQRQHRSDAFTQTRIAFALKIATIITATIAVFYGDLILIFSDALQNEAAIYILAVPFIIAYLVYRKRKMFRAVIPLNCNNQPKNTRNLASLSGVLVAATAVLLYWQGSYQFTPLEAHIYAFTPIRLHILALPIFATGLILILFNPQALKQLALPVAFLFFLTPPPSEIPAAALLGGFLLISAATIIFLLVSERAFRTHTLSKNPAKCNQCDQELPSNRDYCRECGRILHPANTRINKANVVKIVVILLIAGFLVTIQSPVFAINKRTPIIPVNTPLGLQYSTQILPEANQYNLTWRGEDHYLETEAAKLHQNLLALEYTYKAIPNESLNNVYVGLELSSSKSSLPPYSTLLRTIQLETASIQINNNYGSPIQAQYFVNQSTDVGSITAVLYWNTSPVFMINQTAQQKQVQTALTIINPPEDELPQVKQQLVDLATQINNYWLPNETWPQATARFLSENGITLCTATSIAIVATLVYYAAETRERKRTNLKAVSKLNTFDAEIVKALQRTSKPATLGNLAATLQKDTGQTITPEQLETRLKELENTGIIRSQVSGQNNVPIQTWKT